MHAGPKVRGAKTKDQYHHGDLRKALVEAAVAMADGEGIDAITTRALARKLGVSHAAPGRHFPDRTALLAEVAAAAYERFARVLKNAAHGERGPAALSAMGRAYVRFGLDHPALLHLMFSRQLGDLDPWPSALAESGRRAYRALQGGVRAALGARASEEKVGLGSFISWSLVHGAVLLYLEGGVCHSQPVKGRKQAFLALADAAVDAATRTVMDL